MTLRRLEHGASWNGYTYISKDELDILLRVVRAAQKVMAGLEEDASGLLTGHEIELQAALRALEEVE